MSTEPTSEPTVILVELAPRPGVQQVALPQPAELAQRSAEALDKAWATIRAMAERTGTLIDDLAGNPDEVQLEYGIKLDVEGNAMIAKAGAEAAISVSVTWKRGGGK